MSYHIYTTRGLVLGEKAWGESDRIYSILTHDLGLVRATALGVRKEESKLRGALEPINLSIVSLVKGKEFWRITSAEVLKTFPNNLSLAKPLSLLEKLIQGEAAHPELFDAIESKLQDFSDDEKHETSLVAEIMYHLGYLKKSDLTLPIKELIQAINHGLEHSHLINRV